jgi:hypothetical protein
MRAYSNLLHMCRHDGIGIIEELGRGESLTECVYCILFHFHRDCRVEIASVRSALSSFGFLTRLLG